jgi:hypothetical protein
VGKSFSKAVQKDRCGEAPALQQIRGGQMLIEGVVSRPFQPRKGASSDYGGQQRGERCAVDRVNSGCFKAAEGSRREFGGCGTEGRSAAECMVILLGEPGTLDDVCRNEPPAGASVERRRAQQPSKRIGDADIMRRLSRSGVVHPEDL